MTSLDKLPLFPLRIVLFPYVSLPLHIFEERYKAMVAQCLESDKPFGIVLADHGKEAGADESIALHTTGTLARIEQAEQLPDGTYNITVRGESRFRVNEVFQNAPYLTADVRTLWETSDDPLEVQPVFDTARELFKEYLEHLYGASMVTNLQIVDDAPFLSYAIPSLLQIELSEKQALLVTNSPMMRLQLDIELLKRELASLRALSQLQEKLSDGDQEIDRTISRLDPSSGKHYFSRS